jgi:hypothetical protein
VFDASGSRLTPVPFLSAPAFLAIINSDVFSYFLKKFIKHNQDVEINDLRAMPVVPTVSQAKRLLRLAQMAITIKRSAFEGDSPEHAHVAWVRKIAQEMITKAPEYLHPPTHSCWWQRRRTVSESWSEL